MDNHVDSGRNEIERWRKKALASSSFAPMAFLMEEMEMEEELEEEVKMKRRISEYRQSVEEQGRKRAFEKNKMREVKGDARGISRTILEQVSPIIQKRGEKGWVEKSHS